MQTDRFILQHLFIDVNEGISVAFVDLGYRGPTRQQYWPTCPTHTHTYRYAKSTAWWTNKLIM